jgi:proline iminopeptidase
MELYNKIDKTKNVNVGNKNYKIDIVGRELPILSIGLGTPSLYTLSDRFKERFEVYSSDLYWVKEHALGNAESITINQIVDDIAELATNLNLSKFFIFGHSAYGIIALEFAKKYPQLVLGIIMSGTPPNSNQQVAETNNAYFEKHASANRKKIDKERRAEFSEEKLMHLSPSEKFKMEYTWTHGPRYWHIPDFDCSDLWQGITIEHKIFNNLFSKILPSIDVRNNLDQIDCPIFLAAGDSDFNCCPFLWNSIQNLPKNMVISQFKESGHWPHYEEQSLFDQRIEAWLKQGGF